MSQTSTMFLNDLSVVDHAYIDAGGHIIGGSFNPCFLVTGEIDPVEKVVVDFSTIKKRLKQMIDDDTTGFDHKCWVIESFSSCGIKVNDELIKQEDFHKLCGDYFDPKDHVMVFSRSATLEGPKDAFKFVERIPGSENYSTVNVGLWFERYLNELFAPENITVKCRNTVNAHTYLPQEDNPIEYFTYVHGLKDSTSWGCQNLAHGHLSFIQLDCDADKSEQTAVLKDIAFELDYTVFINRANVTEECDLQHAKGKFATIEYETSRGKFTGNFSELNQGRRQKVRILETETTIEFLTEFVKSNYSERLKTINAKGLYVSEGLSKGAYIQL